MSFSLLKFFGFKKNKPKQPTWRLVPDAHGTYTLEKWVPSISMYLVETVHVTPEKAELQINRLNGKVLYFVEKELNSKL